MKEWKKPEILNLETKYTETNVMGISGGGFPDEPTDPIVSCPECNKTMNKSQFHNPANHKGNCSYFKNCVGAGCPCK